MKLSHLIVASLLIIPAAHSKTGPKSMSTSRTEIPPVIDGIVDEAIWNSVQPATDFYRFEPESGGHAPVKTEVRILYDNVALYVAATMYDPDPASIPRQLGKRDDDDVKADWLGLWINPFNDGANEVGFMLTAAGVQVDAKYSPNGSDESWDPVWTGDVSFHEEGWSLEMAIPFSQIRFPAKEIQTWGFNVARNRALVREIYTWAELDKANENYAQQTGRLDGIENIETPLRLSFTPYAAVSVEHFPFDEQGKSNFSSIYRGGMDLKYGINESFTLDMTLIPDFGQVQSDNEVLNLSPFEIHYSEHRPFFTEGTQLLQKAGIFYSRRVGSTPGRFWQVADEEVLKDGEVVISNPDETQLINATKVTGQTVNGFEVGFFNALTAPVHASIRDSLGHERDFLTNPLSNYNLVVVGKNLKNGSNFSIINTNVQRFSDSDTTNDFRDANVIGFETRLSTQDSKWILRSSGAYDRLIYQDSASTGYRFNVGFHEDQGMLKYGVEHDIKSEFFNPNDMGFLSQANEFSQYGWIELQTLNPVWKVNEAEVKFNISYSSLFNPRVYSHVGINGNYDVTFKNYLSIGGGLYWRPKESHDYYEPRVDGGYFVSPKWFEFHNWISSNYNKAFSANAWFGTSAKDDRGSSWHGGGVSPRWRVNNRWFMRYDFEMHSRLNNHGFADFDSLDNPVFGKRDHITITNSFYSSYIFSHHLESDISVRYYRSTVEYKEFFDLLEDGNLSSRSFDVDQNTVFGVFTIDAGATWRFTPGSELNITWKNTISADGDNPDIPYMDDLRDLPGLDQSNSISIKLLYYIDYWDLKHR
ncbi:carbohydrate binding family 9 domain-containing protein [bacterium]|nr:carbohydrate binding family 9 domain-containing protein [bacterium]